MRKAIVTKIGKTPGRVYICNTEEKNKKKIIGNIRCILPEKYPQQYNTKDQDRKQYPRPESNGKLLKKMQTHTNSTPKTVM